MSQLFPKDASKRGETRVESFLSFLRVFLVEKGGIVTTHKYICSISLCLRFSNKLLPEVITDQLLQPQDYLINNKRYEMDFAL